MDMVVSASNLGILPWLVVNWFIYSHESHESHEFFLGDFSLSNSDVPRFFPRFPDLRCQVGNPMTPQRCRDLMHQLHLQAGLDQRRTSESKTGLWRGFFLLTVFRSRTSGSLYLFFLIVLSIFFQKIEKEHTSLFGFQVYYPTYIQHIYLDEGLRTHPSISRWNLRFFPVKWGVEWGGPFLGEPRWELMFRGLFTAKTTYFRHQHSQHMLHEWILEW